MTRRPARYRREVGTVLTIRKSTSACWPVGLRADLGFKLPGDPWDPAVRSGDDGVEHCGRTKGR